MVINFVGKLSWNFDGGGFTDALKVKVRCVDHCDSSMSTTPSISQINILENLVLSELANKKTKQNLNSYIIMKLVINKHQNYK